MYKSFENHLKTTIRPLKFFFLIIITMEQLRWQNAQQKCLNKILEAENTLLDLGMKKEL